jgi:hypothetical protein
MEGKALDFPFPLEEKITRSGLSYEAPQSGEGETNLPAIYKFSFSFTV